MHEHFECIRTHVGLHAVHRTLDRLAPHDFSIAFHEYPQQSEFAPRQVDPLATIRDLEGTEVERDGTGLELVVGKALRTTSQRTDASGEFVEMKGLGHVVIGARIEALYAGL